MHCDKQTKLQLDTTRTIISYMSELMSYNTRQEPILLKEYGRSVQNLAEHIVGLTDEEEKLRKAHALVKLMKQINPNLRDENDVINRLWDHLFYISGSKLNIENAPYPRPEKEFNVAPLPVPYGGNRIKYKHYGKTVENMIVKACALEDPKEKEGAVIAIGKIMKRFYTQWNKDLTGNSIIIKDLEKLSDGALTIDPALVEEFNLFKVSAVRSSSSQGGRDNNRSGGRRNQGGANNRQKSNNRNQSGSRSSSNNNNNRRRKN